jgi:hypothetical protein
MSELQTLGKRLDDVLKTIQTENLDLADRFKEYITDKFLLLINSDTNKELEDKIIKSLNGWLDMLDMELKGLFEYKQC